MPKKNKPSTDTPFSKSRFYDLEAEEEASEELIPHPTASTGEETNELLKYHQQQADKVHAQNIEKQRKIIENFEKLADEDEESEEDISRYEQGKFNPIEKAETKHSEIILTEKQNRFFMIRCKPAKEYQSVLYLGKKVMLRHFEQLAQKQSNQIEKDNQIEQKINSHTPSYQTLSTTSTEDIPINSFYVPAPKTGYFYVELNSSFNPDTLKDLVKGFVNILHPFVPRVVPTSEIPKTFAIQKKPLLIPIGSFCRPAIGKYTGDLAQVISINSEAQQYEIRIIPRLKLNYLLKSFTNPKKQIQKENKEMVQNQSVIHKKNEYKSRTSISKRMAPVLITDAILTSNDIPYKTTRNTSTGAIYKVIGGKRFKEGFLYMKMSAQRLEAERNPSPMEMRSFLDVPMEDQLILIML